MSVTNLIIDSHVHYYDGYDLDKFFDMAIKNMDNMYSSLYTEGDNFQKILLFTEGKEKDYFSRLKTNGNFGKQSKYKFENTQEDCAIILLQNDQINIDIV